MKDKNLKELVKISCLNLDGKTTLTPDRSKKIVEFRRVVVTSEQRFSESVSSTDTPYVPFHISEILSDPPIFLESRVVPASEFFKLSLHTSFQYSFFLTGIF